MFCLDLEDREEDLSLCKAKQTYVTMQTYNANVKGVKRCIYLSRY